MLPAAQPTTVRLDLDERSYDIVIGVGLLETLGERLALRFGQGRRAFVIYDAGLPDAVVINATRSLAHHGFFVSAASVHADETQKTLGAAARVLLELAESKHERADPIIALGGGIAGDIGGFVAAVYLRGVPVVQCPTTLLSMVDASVGGKTGVNLLTVNGLKKNYVGAFWQPGLTLADVSALESLPDRHLRCGLAECIKHAMLGAMCADPGLFDWTERAINPVLGRDTPTLVELVARNVALKAGVVSGDERESASLSGTGRPNAGPDRALLNLGHTFAHVIETLPGLSPDGDPANAPLRHGEAVGLGLIAASATSEALGLAEPLVRKRVTRALRDAGLPTTVRGLPPSPEFLEAMRADKKVSGGRLRLILPTEIGHARVIAEPDAEAVAAGLDSIRAQG